MDSKAIKDLYVGVFTGNRTVIPAEFSNKDINVATREALKELAPDIYAFQKNKYDIFRIISETYDEVLPAYVKNFIGDFAEIKYVQQNQKAIFNVRPSRGRKRALKFVTRVGLSGVYEAFRLDVKSFEVGATAHGGRVEIDFERMISGEESLTEPLELMAEGFKNDLYLELIKALLNTINGSDMPSANVATTSTFDPNELQKLISITNKYGNGNSVIFATEEFVQAMGPDAVGMPIYAPYALTSSPTAGSAPGYATPVYSPRDINDIATLGFITQFRGTPIIQLPQNFEDDSNSVLQVPPSYAYIFPTGQEKIIKVVFEGDTIVDEFKKRTREMEIEAYRKFGVAILTTNNWCAYRNLALETEYNFVDYTTTKKNPYNMA